MIEPSDKLREYWDSLPDGKEMEARYRAYPESAQRILCRTGQAALEQFELVLAYCERARG